MKYASKQVVWPVAIIAAGVALVVLWWAMARQAAPLTEPTAVLPVTEMAESAISRPDMAAPLPDPSASSVPPAEMPVAALPLAADRIGSALTSFLGSKAALTFF